MENIDQRYLVQQNKLSDGDRKPPVFAKVMRSKEGKFEGVSFIKNKEKASVMTVQQAQEVIDWATSKKANAREYATKIICVGQ
jgi:tRNA G18 (ribose-2'-O)-methylase SpoU